MQDDFIPKEDLPDTVVEELPSSAVIADALLPLIVQRLDRYMPDVMGEIWPVVSKRIATEIKEALDIHARDSIDPIVHAAVEKVCRDAEIPPLCDVYGCTDVEGCDTAEIVNSANHVERVAFLRAFVSRLLPDVLTDLQSEIVRS